MPLQSSENKVLQKLSGIASLSDVDENLLRDMAAKHPYFGIAHFFIAKHSLQQQSPQAEKDMQMAALYFNNTPWLKYQLHKQENYYRQEMALADTLAGINEPLSEEDESFLQDDAVIHNVEEDVVADNLTDENAEIISASPDSIAEENSINDEVDNLAIDEPQLIKEQESHDENVQSISDEPTTIGTNHEIIQTGNGEPELIDDQESLDESEPINDEVDAAISSRLGSILQQQAAEMNKPVSDDEHLPVEIQQHYRSDYFASQGIKLETEPATNDQLGNKLKKFTDWLRQMKRISPNPADLGTDTTTEKYIQHIADNSNETKEIVTETMAEVLVKQQKAEHAIDIYKKLSLLHPEKEAYFAAKIDELKNLS